MMPERARIWVDAEDAPQGSVARLYGPDGAGGVDTTKLEPGGRARSSAGEDLGTHSSGQADGPAEMGPQGAEARPACLLSGPHVFGRLMFGVTWLDRRTHEESALTTVTAFVNAEPQMPTALIPAAALDAGRMKFTFYGGLLAG